MKKFLKNTMQMVVLFFLVFNLVGCGDGSLPEPVITGSDSGGTITPPVEQQGTGKVAIKIDLGIGDGKGLGKPGQPRVQDLLKKKASDVLIEAYYNGSLATSTTLVLKNGVAAGSMNLLPGNYHLRANVRDSSKRALFYGYQNSMDVVKGETSTADVKLFPTWYLENIDFLLVNFPGGHTEKNVYLTDDILIDGRLFFKEKRSACSPTVGNLLSCQMDMPVRNEQFHVTINVPGDDGNFYKYEFPLWTVDLLINNVIVVDYNVKQEQNVGVNLTFPLDFDNFTVTNNNDPVFISPPTVTVTTPVHVVTTTIRFGWLISNGGLPQGMKVGDGLLITYSYSDNSETRYSFCIIEADNGKSFFCESIWDTQKEYWNSFSFKAFVTVPPPSVGGGGGGIG